MTISTAAGGVEDDLRALAAAAAPTTVLPPGIAADVLRRSRLGRRRRLAAAGAGTLVVVAAVAAASLPGRSAYFEMIQPSAAMAPTVTVGDVVVLARTLRPAAGDVVLVRITHQADGEPAFDMVSRIVATAGQTVSCPADPAGACGAVVVDGQRLAEPYADGPTAPFAAVTVSAGAVFLLGDNRDAARDSRVIGPVPADAVTGVAVRIKDQARVRVVPGAPVHPGPEEGGLEGPGDIPPARTAP